MQKVEKKKNEYCLTHFWYLVSKVMKEWPIEWWKPEVYTILSQGNIKLLTKSILKTMQKVRKKKNERHSHHHNGTVTPLLSTPQPTHGLGRRLCGKWTVRAPQDLHADLVTDF